MIDTCGSCGCEARRCACVVPTSRVYAAAKGAVIPRSDVTSMARELLAVRAERTNDAHREQLDQATATVARSLARQFLLKVASITLTADQQHQPDDQQLSAFFEDLARNAVGGIQELIARE